MSCVTDAAGASLILVVAGVSFSAPPQKAGLNATPAKLTISAPANVVAVLQRPMIFLHCVVPICRLGTGLSPDGFARGKTARGPAVCQSHLPISGNAETKFATLGSFCCCLAVGQACKFGGSGVPLSFVTRAGFVKNAIPTPVARAAKLRRAQGPILVLAQRLHALASSRCAVCELRRTARRGRGGVSARNRNDHRANRLSRAGGEAAHSSFAPQRRARRSRRCRRLDRAQGQQHDRALHQAAIHP